jgi:WD40-like Beta Propeller Repeat
MPTVMERGSVRSAQTAGATSLNIAYSTGIVSGDVVILWLYQPGGAGTYACTGFTLRQTARSLLAWRTCDGSEGGTFTITGLDSGYPTTAITLAFYNANGFDPQVPAAASSNSGSDSNPTINGIEAVNRATTIDGDMLLWAVGFNHASATVTSGPWAGVASNYQGTARAALNKTVQGAHGVAGTLSGVISASAPWVVQCFALKYNGPVNLIVANATHAVVSTNIALTQKWVRALFISKESGHYEIYKTNYNMSGQVRLTNNSTHHCVWPRQSPDGKSILFHKVPIAYNPDSDYTHRDLWMMDSDGSNQRLIRAAGVGGWTFLGCTEWSPSGTRLVTFGGAIPQIYTMDPDGGNVTQITNRPSGLAVDPSWSPDGNWVVYIGKLVADDATKQDLYKCPWNGGAETRLTNNSYQDNDPCWSPDNLQLVWEQQVSLPDEAHIAGVWNICKINADGTNQITILNDGNVNTLPRWSPIDNKIYFYRFIYGSPHWQLARMNPDGTGIEALTNEVNFDHEQIDIGEIPPLPSNPLNKVSSDNVVLQQILHVRQRGATTTVGVTAATVDIPKPTGVVAGDVMILWLFQAGGTGTYACSGFTLRQTGRLLLAWKVCNGTEGANFTVTGVDAGYATAALGMAFYNTSGLDCQDPAAAYAITGTNTTPTITGIEDADRVPTQDGDVILWLLAFLHASATITAYPWTEFQTSKYQGSARIGVSGLSQSSKAAVGEKAGSISVAPSVWVVQSIALRYNAPLTLVVNNAVNSVTSLVPIIEKNLGSVEKIVWGKIGTKVYEGGLDRGVLYLNGIAIPWNGLTSIVENPNKEISSTYFDGAKISTLISIGEYSATMKAITYPNEFAEIEGIGKLMDGVYLGNQRPQTFDLSYRTMIGNDIDGPGASYKIHILYNVTAIPKDKTYETMTTDPSLMEFEWDILAVPEDIDGYNPTAHIVIDSTDISSAFMEDIESILYGISSELPSLPDFITYLQELSSATGVIVIWITDNGDGTWTATSDDNELIFVDGSGFFRISNANATFSGDSFDISDTIEN